MSDGVIYYLFGVLLGFFAGFFISYGHFKSCLKAMGFWILYKAFLRKAKVDVEVKVIPKDEKSKKILQFLVTQSQMNDENIEVREER